MAHVIGHGETGLFIAEPTPAAIADAIEALPIDRTRAQVMSLRVRQLALSRYDSRIRAKKILALYKRMAHPSPKMALKVASSAPRSKL